MDVLNRHLCVRVAASGWVRPVAWVPSGGKVEPIMKSASSQQQERPLAVSDLSPFSFLWPAIRKLIGFSGGYELERPKKTRLYRDHPESKADGLLLPSWLAVP